MMEHNIIRAIVRKKTYEKIKQKALYLGIDDSNYVASFLYYRLIISILLFGLCFFLSKYGLLIALGAVLIFRYLSEYLIFDYRIKKRSIYLEKEAIIFLNVFLLTYKDNQNFVQSLILTSNNLDNGFAKEMKLAFLNTAFKNSFKDAMLYLKTRMPSKMIQSMLLSLITLSETLNLVDIEIEKLIQNLDNREKQNNIFALNKLPIKVTSVSILFYIIIALVIILGRQLIIYCLN